MSFLSFIHKPLIRRVALFFTVKCTPLDQKYSGDVQATLGVTPVKQNKPQQSSCDEHLVSTSDGNNFKQN